MRSFADGDTITVEPWRADPFPVIKDLVVHRGDFDRIIAAGGFVSINTGAAPEAHATPVPKSEAAACIGCGACVAACPNASAMLFTAAKITHLGALPQGQPERAAVCPAGVPLETISQLNADLRKSLTPSRRD